MDEFSDERRLVLIGDGTSKWVGAWWRWLSVRQIYIERFTPRGKDVRSDFAIPSLQNVVADSIEDDDLHYLVRSDASVLTQDL